MIIRSICDTQALSYPNDFSGAILAFFAADAIIKVVHPFNELQRADTYLNNFLRPLQKSFDGLYRRDDIFMAGQFEGLEWISSTGYYVEWFAEDWIGIKATGMLSYLRYGEFHRVEKGKVLESYIYLDVPELMIACNQWPLSTRPGMSRDHTGLIQVPASRDGVIIDATNLIEDQRSYQKVTDMLARLATKDEAWRPYWHENMIWYGPGAFGSFIDIDEVTSFQVPFDSQFDGWSGESRGSGMTKHFTKNAERNYTCSGGWPSLTSVKVKPFLGQGPTNKRVFVRVRDWWRREDSLLVENWVFVDVPHGLLQLGFDWSPNLQSGKN